MLCARAEPLLDAARRGARGRGGAALLDTFDRFNRSLADAPALRRFVEQERDGGAADHHIRRGQRAAAHRRPDQGADRGRGPQGAYDPPVEPATLAYAIVRLAEAFLFNDAVAGMRGDVDRLREVEAALLGVHRSPDPRRAGAS